MTASVTFSPRKASASALSLAQNHGRDFFWRVFLVAHLDLDAIALLDDFVWHDVVVFLDFFVAKVATDQALYFINSVLGIGHPLALSNLADQTFAVLVDSNDGWCRAITFGVSDNFRLAGTIYAIAELVVPRSIPIILPILVLLLCH